MCSSAATTGDIDPINMNRTNIPVKSASFFIITCHFLGFARKKGIDPEVMTSHTLAKQIIW
jgi:hypothetical protein